MFNKKTIHIELHLPKSWNQCTTEELEIIAAAIIEDQQRVDRYHPFDWSRVKLNVVLSINEITVSGGASKYRDIDISTHRDNDKTSDADWLVRRPEDKEPWPISVGQLVALTDMLSWLDDEKSDKTIFMFPYPELTLVQGSGFKVHGSKPLTINRKPLTVAGPPPLLDGYTWREYRWLTDWMQEYMRRTNAHLDATSAQREFLAILFKPAEKTSGEAPDTVTSTISPLTSDLFTAFSPVKWQVILFWWSSLMAQLAKKFPKVFKSQPVGKKQRRPQKDTPWDFYNRVTATIQKYIGGLSAQAVDDQPYSVTLQQLEMMADEAAEREKIKNKK